MKTTKSKEFTEVKRLLRELKDANERVAELEKENDDLDREARKLDALREQRDTYRRVLTFQQRVIQQLLEMNPENQEDDESEDF